MPLGRGQVFIAECRISYYVIILTISIAVILIATATSCLERDL